MAKEDDYPYPTQALPTPTDTPYRTPSRSVSRRCSPSPGPSSSPSTFLPNTDSYFRGQGEPKDVANDENISILDPRRFTPSLHASLVSEILYRRRDLESKTGLIENLESTLYAARNENNTLNETLTSNVNEIRSLKHQLQLLESGSLSAAEELAEERDEALASLADTRQRLEASKKKVRGLEEEAERTHALWDGDQRNWEGERRNLERKVHVAEARLKTVLAEIAAAQANDQSQGAESDGEEMTEDLRSGSALGRRAMSNISNGTRFSMLSGPNGYGGGKMYGLSLADELALDEEEGEDSQDSDLDGGRISPDALPEERSERRASSIMTREDQKARKVLGLPIEPTQESAATIVSEPSTTEKPPFPDSDEKTTVTDELQYIDTGVQFSPPASPEPDAVSNDRHEERIPSAIEQGANQCRKRTSISPVTPVDQSGITSSTQMSACMVSSAAQTIGDLPSPPSTPRDSLSTISQGHDSCPVAVEMSSSSTQTEETNASSELRVSNASTPLSPPVPTITIHPPLSAPSSPRNSVVLPPHTKSTACQASIASSVKLRSISVQTEEIRIDNRAIKLPAKLLPSAISSQPPTPQPSDLEEDPESLILNSPKSATDAGPNSQNHPPVRPPPPQPRQSSSDSEGAYSRKNDRGPLSWTEPSAIWRPVRSSSSKLEGAGPNQSEEAYPGKNDNGPLDPARPEKIRRPFRTSSLFAGFDTGSDEDAGHCGETEMSDDDFRNAAPIRKTLSKVHNAWKLVPQSPRPLFGDNEIREVDEEEGAKHGHKHTGRDNAHVPIAGRGLSAERQLNAKSTDLVSKWSHNTKQPDMRKTALISNGTAAHSQRSRSPSLPTSNSTTTTVAAPPFPVPTRSSSRRPPLSASDGAQSPTPYSGGMNPGNQHREPSRPPTKKYIIRKVRSAAAIAHNENHERNNSQSTPPMSASSAAPDSPQHPPMPMNAMNSTRYGHVAQLYKHDQRPSTGTTDAGNNTVDSSVQQTSVVDAIAQTMVGEWMWKYVRRRKSFGVAESPQADWEVGKSATDGSTNTTGTGIRHKRWVWVAPYERAVMWSSKQPTSGSALLGKSGRKLMIQSVLDVKDDSPSSKGSNTQQTFGRSILILTPQRALKFTATSKERHYVWLTALSFLSHSTLGAHDLDFRPPVPKQEDEPPPRQAAATLRRNPIRDSIRVAKGKARPNINGSRAYTSPVGGIRPEPIQEADLHYGPNEQILDAAEPPHVPRFSSHTRKRSNTGPRPSGGAFRGLANHAAFTSNHSLNTATSGEGHVPTTFGGINHGSGRSSFSQRTSEAGGRPGIIVNNFFDAVGTVRMEAFVDRPRRYDGEEQVQRPPRKSYRTRQGRKKDMSYWGAQRVEEGGEVVFRPDDPFRGF